MSEDFLIRHPEVRVERVWGPIAGINDLTAPSYSCRQCESGRHDRCSDREYDISSSFDCSCAEKTLHFEWIDVAEVPLALLAELNKNTVYVVAHHNGDDMCGGLNIHGTFTSKAEAEERRDKVNAADGFGAEVYPIPLDTPGWLGYLSDGFEPDA